MPPSPSLLPHSPLPIPLNTHAAVYKSVEKLISVNYIYKTKKIVISIFSEVSSSLLTSPKFFK